MHLTVWPASIQNVVRQTIQSLNDVLKVSSRMSLPTSRLTDLSMWSATVDFIMATMCPAAVLRTHGQPSERNRYTRDVGRSVIGLPFALPRTTVNALALTECTGVARLRICADSVDTGKRAEFPDRRPVYQSISWRHGSRLQPCPALRAGNPSSAARLRCFLWRNVSAAGSI